MYFGGVVTVSWVTFGTLHWPQSGISSDAAYSSEQWAWRLPILLQALGPVILLCFTSASLRISYSGTQVPFNLPESPRWLVARGYVSEAHSVLAQLHANGDMQDELVLGELGEIRGCLMKEQEESVGKGMWDGWKDWLA